MSKEQNGLSPEDGADREAHIAEAKQNVREVAGFLQTNEPFFKEELYLKLEAELEDAIEVFFEEELAVERAYALGLYEQLKQRRPINTANPLGKSAQDYYHVSDVANTERFRREVASADAIEMADNIVTDIENDLLLNERDFGQLSPTIDELAEWRRKLDTAVAISNHPIAQKHLSELKATFPKLWEAIDQREAK